MGILEGISRPVIANVPSAFARGQDRGRLRDERDRADEVRRLSGEILAKSFPGRLGELAKVDPDAAIKLGGALGFSTDPLASTKFFAGAIQGASAIASTVGPKEAVAALIEWRNILEARGLETAPLDTLIQSGIDQPDDFVEGLGLAKDALVEQGLLKPAGDDAQIKSIAENRKEIRKSVRGQIKGLRDEEGTITTNFRKIRRLGDEIDKGNRSAVSQALVALVKIGDPTSVVRPSEAAAALNNPSVLAALFTDAGTDQRITDAAIRAIDPLNPGVLNKDAILATADAMVLASVPGIQARFGDAKEEGGGLTRNSFDSIFTGRLESRINALSNLVPKKEMTDDEKRARIAELEALGGP